MVDDGPTPMQRRLQLAVNGFLVLLVPLMAMSIFTETGAPLMTLVSITVLLLLVRNSTGEMAGGKSRG